MIGSRPLQAALTRDTDLSKTDETRAVIEGMVDGLNDLEDRGLDRFFASDFRWMGNTGCGTKPGLQAFLDNWVAPFRAAFTDKVCIDEGRVFMGEWAAAFGRQEAVHSGPFMGIPGTGKSVEICYMDFWKVRDGTIVDNWVMVDFPHILAQLGVDVFKGEGWEKLGRTEHDPAKRRYPPRGGIASGTRPEQGAETSDTDLANTQATKTVIETMVDGLNDHRIDDIGEFFSPEFRWIGNTGCGTKIGLEDFQEGWQRPFQAAFSDKVCTDEARLFMGDWAAAFGHQKAIHSGTFLGVEPTGKQVEIRFMDFWKVRDGKIVDNWVMVDFPHILSQLGIDIFDGEGWETFDRGEKSPPQPTAIPSHAS